jgi:hypothetical protein
MMPAALRANINVSIVARDAEMAAMQQPIRELALIDGPDELAVVLQSLALRSDHCNTSPPPATLDLIAHSAGDERLLKIGGWKVDGEVAAVRAFFTTLAQQRTLARLGVASVRLLGCYTASTPRARATLRTLRDILGVEVCGTTCIVDRRCFDEGGLKPYYEDILSAPAARSASPD